MTAYRYLLERETGALVGRAVGLFVMLNPSTADENHDDPTIRRCVGFARREAWAWMRVVNLFAARATDPRELLEIPRAEMIGPGNDDVICGQIKAASIVVAAWGATQDLEFAASLRVRQILDALGGHAVEWFCLGVAKYGAPRHPLYVRKDAPLRPWRLEDWRIDQVRR